MALKGFSTLKRSRWVSEQLLDCCITLHVDSDAGFENVQRGHGLSTAFICDWKMKPDHPTSTTREERRICQVLLL